MSEVQTLDRAISILNVFSSGQAELGVSEIARASGLTKTTVHRILGSLVKNGVLQRTEDGTAYRFGGQVLRWAGVAQAQIDIRRLAKPLMQTLRDQVGETVGLHVLDGRHRQVLDQVESRSEIRRTYTEIGQPIAIHLGAPGKLLLAYLDSAEREYILASPLEAATRETKINADSLRKELALIRKQGFAMSFQERIVGVASMAVPVRDHTDQRRFAISVSGPADRLTRARLLAAVEPALQAAARLSDLLGAPAIT